MVSENIPLYSACEMVAVPVFVIPWENGHLAVQNGAPLLVTLLQPQKDTEQKEKNHPFPVQ